ncbi:MAG: hypothetical protein EHM78_21540 [Myxococcaceae bacterium]|nr:MAG: hypothetical protein EHM78_21540 [Myxococcaceae bacterium]
MRLLPAILLLVAACSTAPRPSPAEAYLAALERDDLDTAWSLTSTRFRQGTDRAAFEARLSDPAARAAHVARVRAALAEGAPELLDVPPPTGQPAGAVQALVRAARAGNFPEAWGWLAAPERARYTPERLARDFEVAPGAAERLSRALAAVEHPGETTGTETRWPLPTGGAVRVVLEDGQPRVAALE